MSRFEQYRSRYEFIELSRTPSGVLTMRLHHQGGPFLWGMRQHEEVADCLLDISRDRENKVVILTGTGDVFLDAFAPPDESADLSSFKENCSYHLSVGYRLIQNHLDIEVPTIALVTGPASIHAELAVLCDIVLCADHAYFADEPHFPSGIVPGDGVHIIWPELLGLNRGRYFILMGERIHADEAKELGIVSEIMPREELEARGRKIAEDLARKDPIVLRHTRAALVQKLRKEVADLLPLGLHASFGAAMAGEPFVLDAADET